MITSWSHSKLVDYEKCAHLAWLKHDKRIPEPERPLPPGKTEHANDRGTRIHTEAELFVSGDEDYFPPEATSFIGELHLLRELFAEGMVSLEGEWAFDAEWNPTDWDSVETWLRLKLDALVFWSPQHATAIDYKSGRKFGNEIKHGEQLQLYQLACFMRYPLLEVVETELWYFDQDEITKKVFTRDQGLRFRQNFDRRGRKLTMATEFKPNPSKFACKWCPYKGTEHCTVGV